MGSMNPLFRNLTAEDPEPEITEVESFCVSCGDNGTTRMLLTKIPFYKDVILISFECKCGYRNNEIQSGDRIEEKGVRITLNVRTPEDLNRTVVKSDFTSIKIPELDFEIPANSQKGEITTVEGVIERSITALRQDQEARAKDHPDVASQIENFCNKLQDLKNLETPFTLIIEDISGHCFLSNPIAPEKDRSADTTLFVRNKTQDHALGIYTLEEIQEEEEPTAESGVLTRPKENFSYESLESEVFQLPSNCPACNAPCVVNSKLTQIPYFKEALIMATNCDACGYRTNEVKSGTGIEPKGVRIEVFVSDAKDLTRDILKSDTCRLLIPELDFEVGPATLGGRFTTVEGLLVNIKDQLSSQGAMLSDSAEKSTKVKMEQFLNKLTSATAGEFSFTLVLDDPAGNSYVQSHTPPDPDDKLKIEHYERSFEQNDDLGLNDMNVDSY